jgi:anti-sigma factor (TIGR02949 family)
MSLMRMHKNKKYDCNDIENLLHAYLDNQLPEEQKLLFEEHLDVCLPCDKKVEFEIKLKRFIQMRAQEHTFPAFLEKELLRVIKNGRANS